MLTGRGDTHDSVLAVNIPTLHHQRQDFQEQIIIVVVAAAVVAAFSFWLFRGARFTTSRFNRALLGGMLTAAVVHGRDNE